MSATAQAVAYAVQEPRPHAAPAHPGRATGPRTAEGKARSRGNAMKHGLYAHQVVIRGESAMEFAEFRADMLGALAPADVLEQREAQVMIMSQWKLERLWRQQPRIYGIHEDALGGDDPDGAYGYVKDSAEGQSLTRLKREETQLQRAYRLAQQQLDLLRDQRFKRLRPFVPLPLVIEEAVMMPEPVALAEAVAVAEPLSGASLAAEPQPAEPAATPSAAEGIGEMPERTPLAVGAPERAAPVAPGAPAYCPIADLPEHPPTPGVPAEQEPAAAAA